MKITNSSSAPKPAPLTGASRAGGPSRQSSAQGAGAATVATDPSSRLGQLETQLSPSDFSAAKVNEITSAIAAGRYQVDAGAVADKLLASAAALTHKSGGAA